MMPNTPFTSWPPYRSGEYPEHSGMIAYFSMEIAITPAMPTYSGGLGVLAGDTLRAAADMGLALVAVTLVHRKGYFKQRLDENGVQSEETSRGIWKTGSPLKTPKRPYEASGTSGMKAALNGVPSLSVLDGWWIEGWSEGVTGWAIRDRDDEIDEANELYDRLEQMILPLFYGQQDAWRRIMRSTIAINGPYFNTERMLMQYVSKAYFPGRRRVAVSAVELDLAS